MALIGNIRKRSGLLLVIVGLAMAAFVLGDLFSNKGAQIIENEVGSIFGEGIGSLEYERRVKDQIDRIASVRGSLDETTRRSIREQVWSDMVKEKVLFNQLEKVGMTVPQEEYLDMIDGENIHPSLLADQSFKNPETGSYDKELALRQLSYIESNFPQYWQMQKRNLIQTRLYSKYYNLIRKGLYVSKRYAVKNYEDQNTKIKANFVAKSYKDVSDSLISFTEEEVKAYYNQHKNDNKFTQKASRKVEYVLFDVKISNDDSTIIKEELSEIKKEFMVTENDSTYVSETNLDGQYSVITYKVGTLPAAFDSLIWKGDSGSIVGPYVENGSFKLAKVKGEVFIADSVQARHILLKNDQGQPIQALLQQADSLKKLIESGTVDFAKLATDNSQDPGSSVKGGDLGWFSQGVMVPSFNDACFFGKKGDMPIVESRFGVHLIEIMEQKNFERAVSIVEILRPIEASEESTDRAYDLASTFAINNSTQEKFDKAVTEKNYIKKTADYLRMDQRNFAGYQDARIVIKWTYKAELGAVSEAFELDNAFVVCLLVEAKEEGVPKLADVRTEMEEKVKNKKKGAYLVNQINGKTSLEDIAKSLEVEVVPVNDMSISSFSFPGKPGSEQAVVGKLCALKEGETSVPIYGEQALFVLQVESVNKADKLSDVNSEKTSLTEKAQGKVEFDVYEALKLNADFKDTRALFE